MPSSETTFFIDTSFHVAYCFGKVEHHEEARAIIEQIRRQCINPTFVTTNLIFAETLNLILRAEWLPKRERPGLARQVGRDIKTYNRIGIISPEMFEMAWDLFERQGERGRSWSFVDCTSFIYIREIRKKRYAQDRLTVKKVLAFDRDFDEAGGEYGFQVIS